MLPDDFENTAQSVVATNFFCNNILESITTKNYWDVGNEYKPLMHTWYVGLLMQFYILVPLLLFFIGRFVKDKNIRKYINICFMMCIGTISLTLYLTTDNECAKFYYLPYRLYEFCAGSLVFYLFDKNLLLLAIDSYRISVLLLYMYVSLHFFLLKLIIFRVQLNFSLL